MNGIAERLLWVFEVNKTSFAKRPFLSLRALRNVTKDGNILLLLLLYIRGSRGDFSPNLPAIFESSPDNDG